MGPLEITTPKHPTATLEMDSELMPARITTARLRTESLAQICLLAERVEKGGMTWEMRVLYLCSIAELSIALALLHTSNRGKNLAQEAKALLERVLLFAKELERGTAHAADD